MIFNQPVPCERNNVFLMPIILGGRSLCCLAAGHSSLLLHSACCDTSLWLKCLRGFVAVPWGFLCGQHCGGLLPARPLSFILPTGLADGLSYFCRLIDQGSEVQLEEFAQGQTACKWQSQNSKPGCYVPRGAGTHPWSGAEVFLTLQVTVSSLVSFSTFPPRTASSNQGL